MSGHHRWCVSLIALGLLSTTARAEEPAGPELRTHWDCWYTNDEHVACIIDEAKEGIAPAVESRRGRLPESVQRIRENPASLQGMLVVIPLFDEPTDQTRVAQLVQQVMCGAASDCRTHYEASPPTMDLKHAARFADLFDPALDMGG